MRRWSDALLLTDTLIIAPAQTGKTTGLPIPAILEWNGPNGPVLATSVKGAIASTTPWPRVSPAATRVFDPPGSTGLAVAAWSPIGAPGSWEGARRTAA